MGNLKVKGYHVSMRAVRYHINNLVFNQLVLWRQAGVNGETYFFLTELGHLMVDEINYLADKLYDMEENEDEFNDF